MRTASTLDYKLMSVTVANLWPLNPSALSWTSHEPMLMQIPSFVTITG